MGKTRELSRLIDYIDEVGGDLVVTADILPNADGTLSIGSATKQFGESWFDDFINLTAPDAWTSGLQFGSAAGGGGAYIQIYDDTDNFLIRKMNSGGGVPVISQTYQTDGTYTHIGDLATSIGGGYEQTAATGGLDVTKINGYWDNNEVAYISIQTGDDTTNKDNGIISFYTYSAAATVAKAMEIDESARIITGGGSDCLGAEQGSVTISTGDSGVTSLNSTADELVIENNNYAGLTIASPDAFYGIIAFGSPSDSTGAKIRWEYGTAGADKELIVGTATPDGKITFQSGDSVVRLTVNGDGNIVTGSGLADVLGAEAGSVTISTGNSGCTSAFGDDLIIEGTNAGMTFCSPATAVSSGVSWGSPGFNANAYIRYDHVDDELTFVADSTVNMIMGTNNTVFCGISTLSDALGAEAGSVTISTGDSGVSAPDASGDDLIIENDANAGISILTPDLNSSKINFGTPTDVTGGVISWDYTTGIFRIGTRTTSGVTTFTAGDNTRHLTINADGAVRIGEHTGTVAMSAADGLTVATGDSGVTAALTNADDLVVEGSGDTGIAVLCPDLNLATVKLGTPSDVGGAHIKWDYTNLLCSVGSINASGATTISYGNGDTGIHIDSTGKVSIGTTVDLGLEKGSLTISTGDSGVTAAVGGADDLIIENDGNAGLSILSPNTNWNYIRFGDPQDNNIAGISYNHSNNNLILRANGASHTTFQSDGSIGVNTADYETLVTNDDDIPNKKYVDDHYSFLVTAEENVALDTTTNSGFQWAFGNGATNQYGVAVPVACEVTHLTLAEKAGTAITATVQLVKNGTAIGTTAQIVLTAAASGTATLATPISFAAGDRMSFQTTTGTAQGAGGVVSALCRST